MSTENSEGASWPTATLTMSDRAPATPPPSQSAVAATLDLPRDAPNRDATVKAVRAAGISWVAKYRRQNEYAGRPSYGATYTAVNALAGHVNNFGTGTPIPAKRADRLKIELSDAERALARGR